MDLLAKFNEEAFAILQSCGLRITPPGADHDVPYLSDPPPPTTEELSARVRAKRGALLAATDYLMMPDCGDA